MGHSQHTLTLYLFRTRPPWLIVLAAEAGALLFAIPCSTVVYVLHDLFDSTDQFTPELPTCYLVSASAVVASISILLYVATQRASFRSSDRADVPSSLRQPADNTTAPPPPPQVASQQPAQQPSRPPISESQQSQRSSLLFDRIPSHLGHDIIFLKAVEHYTQVTTTRDNTLVLLRFSDTVTSLGSLGIQVHRSYWVAYRHIKLQHTRGDRVFLQLSGGHEVPVSRPHRADVQRYLKTLSDSDPAQAP